jgi:hypothetical protein
VSLFREDLPELTAAGPKPPAETVQQLNKALARVKAGWQLK